MSAKLFVGGLAWATTDESLQNFFAQVGTVVSAIVIKDKFSGRSKGFGFVEMSSEEEARQAVEQLNGKTLDGRTIIVNEARPQAPRDQHGGGGRGGKRDFNRGGGGRSNYDDRGGRDW